MQKPVGGADKIAAVSDCEDIVHAQTWNQAGDALGTVRKRTRWTRPNHLRLDQVGPGDTYVLYFDGTGGWEILPDKTVADLAGGELALAKKYVRDFQFHKWLADHESRFKNTSPIPVIIRIGDSSEPTHHI